VKCPGAQGEQYPGRFPLAMHRRRQPVGCTGCCGPRAYTVDRMTRHHQLAGNRESGWNIARPLSTRSFPASRPGTMARTTSLPVGRTILHRNGISIYVAAKDDPKMKDLAEDTYHAFGRSARSASRLNCSSVPILAFNSPNIRTPQRLYRLHAGEGKYEKCFGRARDLTHTLNAYDSAPCGPPIPEPGVQPGQQRALPASASAPR